jgi:hypothetical protein
MGYMAGAQAAPSVTDTNFGSIFIGVFSGMEATNAGQSVFLGNGSGSDATNAFGSTFIGTGAGGSSVDASGSIFLGGNAGSYADNAKNSLFIGVDAGRGDNIVNTSTTIQYTPISGTFQSNEQVSGSITSNTTQIITDNGSQLVMGAMYVPYVVGEILTGQDSGATGQITSITTGSTSILIGTQTNTGGYINSIALGSRAQNTAVNQFMIGSQEFPIDEIRVVQTGGTQCIIDGTGLGCTSDERLKTNITDLSNNILDSLTKVRTVTYNWKANPSSSQMIGFLAQDLEQYFPQLVGTNEQGQKSITQNGCVMRPLIRDETFRHVPGTATWKNHSTFHRRRRNKEVLHDWNITELCIS